MRTNARCLLLLFALMGCSATSCSRAEPRASTQGSSATSASTSRDQAAPLAAVDALAAQVIGDAEAAPGADNAAARHQDAATLLSECAPGPLQRSRCMIEAVLRDIKATYPLRGGGGISNLRLVATDTYAASIAQEERLDVIIYTLELDDHGQAVIRKRTESTRSAGP